MENNSGYEALGARLIIKPDAVEETIKGSILVKPVADMSKESAATISGTVIQIGAECWLDHPVKDWCQAGDHILYGKYRGYEIEGHDGEKYRIIGDLDVVAKINDKQGG